MTAASVSPHPVSLNQNLAIPFYIARMIYAGMIFRNLKKYIYIIVCTLFKVITLFILLKLLDDNISENAKCSQAVFSE